jgi:hypothetical protein
MSRIVAIVLAVGLFLAPTIFPTPTRGASGPDLARVVNLESLLEGRASASADAGGGVTLKLTAGTDPMQDLAILADGRVLKKLEGGRFTACARLEAGGATFWSIAEYTGGAHCCAQFTFLARAAAGQPVRFLGQTAGYNGGPRDFPGSFVSRGGQLYFVSYDNRFDYFHASHAESLLVNVPRTHYLITPTALRIDNLPFKDVYVKEAAEVDREISQEAARRNGKPQALLRPGFGAGFEGLAFADTLGQLLVKRSILYLYAREDKVAWDTFNRDVSRYYQTSAWAKQLQQEIAGLMRTAPY